MSFSINDEELIKHILSINGIHKDLNQEIKQNWSAFLEDFQQLRLDAYRARQEIANLEQKLYHARRNLEEEKQKRRAVEQQRDLLESCIDMARKILFHNEETNLDDAIKEKLQFLNKITIKNEHNNLCVRDTRRNGQQMEMDSTGSILSDLNCLSKSEDDSDIKAIHIQIQGEWKRHRPSCEYLEKKQCSTLDKVAEFNSLDKATTVKSNNDAHAASSQTQAGSVSKTADTKTNAKEPSNHHFVSKMILKPETCIACDKRIRFGKMVLTCKGCPVICHIECKSKVARPCVHEEIAILCGFTKK